MYYDIKHFTGFFLLRCKLENKSCIHPQSSHSLNLIIFFYMQLVNCVARNIQFTYNSQLFANSLPLLAFYKFLYLCKLSTISEGELADFVHLLKSINTFFDYKIHRDAHKASILLLDIFSNICNLPLKENKISTVPKFVDSFFSGIYKNFLYLQTVPRNKYLLQTFSSYYCTTKYRYIFIFG